MSSPRAVKWPWIHRQLLHAEVRITGVSLTELDKTFQAMEQLADELRKKGHNPQVFPPGADMPLGAAGHVVVSREISRQLTDLGITADRLVVANGAGGTQAGLTLGAKYYELPFRVIGCSVATAKEVCQLLSAELCNNTAKMLGLGITMGAEEFDVSDDYIRDGYGTSGNACTDGIKLVAKTEPIFLAPAYTGMAMAGLTDSIHKEKSASTDTAILIHKGGDPALFAYSKEVRTRAKPESTI